MHIQEEEVQNGGRSCTSLGLGVHMVAPDPHLNEKSCSEMRKRLLKRRPEFETLVLRVHQHKEMRAGLE